MARCFRYPTLRHRQLCSTLPPRVPTLYCYCLSLVRWNLFPELDRSLHNSKDASDSWSSMQSTYLNMVQPHNICRLVTRLLGSIRTSTSCKWNLMRSIKSSCMGWDCRRRAGSVASYWPPSKCKLSPQTGLHYILGPWCCHDSSLYYSWGRWSSFRVDFHEGARPLDSK